MKRVAIIIKGDRKRACIFGVYGGLSQGGSSQDSFWRTALTTAVSRRLVLQLLQKTKKFIYFNKQQ